MAKDADAYRTIGEAAEALAVPAHVLRFWETRFAQVKPMKWGGGRRYYRPTDVDLLSAIRRLLYEDGYTIRGVQRLLKAQGAAAVAALPRGAAPPPEPDDAEPPADADGADRVGGRSTAALLAELETEVAACRALLAEALGSRREADSAA